MNDPAREHRGAYGMNVVFERGHDTEVATAAPDAPEEVRVVLLAGRNEVALGGYHVCRDEVVTGEAELWGEPAESAAKSKAGNACCGHDARRNSETEGLGLMVRVTQRHARLDPGGASDRIDVYAFHCGQVDQ